MAAHRLIPYGNALEKHFDPKPGDTTVDRWIAAGRLPPKIKATEARSCRAYVFEDVFEAYVSRWGAEPEPLKAS